MQIGAKRELVSSLDPYFVILNEYKFVETKKE